jgi:hypothetical protein
MTGYESKKAAAQAKTIDEVNWADHELDDDDTQVYQDHDDTLTIAYQSGYYDGKKAAQTTQEPKSVTYKEVADTMNALRKGNFSQKAAAEEAGKLKLYTAPPQRPWVGLTDKDRMQILDTTEGDERGFVMKLVEDKLKEKNEFHIKN